MQAAALLYNDGMRLAAIRKARGLSQSELADLADIEQPTVSKIERGFEGVTLRTLNQIAKALDISLADLLIDERSAAEETLLQAFRELPPERQQGWTDMALALSQGLSTPTT